VIGAGYMGRGIAYQILTAVPGMILSTVCNRTVSDAERAYRQAGVEDLVNVDSTSRLEEAIQTNRAAVTDNPFIVCEAANIDVIIEATGTIEFATHVVLHGIKHGKHVVLMNAELDATIGPLLKKRADEAGVILTNSDGDQPGVIMNLFRYVEAIGMQPVLAGNIKGLQDPYRTPTTQKGFAEKYNQKAQMVTSFADGTKISMEMATVANATGFRVGKRGMFGFACKHVSDTPNLFPKDQMLNVGLVDYVIGAEPPGGVFVIGYHDDPIQQQYLNYYKLGNGPFYVFYNPFHICHFEVPLTAARAVLFDDATIAPLAGPVVDVVAVAKRDLKRGETLDSIGGYTTYGVAENSDICVREKLLPMGLAEGCRLEQDIAIDQVICYQDVELPKGRLCDTLRAEQTNLYMLGN
jgi:predicted homoserine dehydrogenase-like protein